MRDVKQHFRLQLSEDFTTKLVFFFFLFFNIYLITFSLLDLQIAKTNHHPGAPL